jgi:hypothetical protein
MLIYAFSGPQPKLVKEFLALEDPSQEDDSKSGASSIIDTTAVPEPVRARQVTEDIYKNKTIVDLEELKKGSYYYNDFED